jgi:hypothetical protein
MPGIRAGLKKILRRICQMVKKLVSSFLVLSVLSVVGCSSGGKVKVAPADKILGIWERVGDRNEGIWVKVDKISGQNVYIGQITRVPDRFTNTISEGDVFWQNVMSSAENQWEGTIIAKNKTLLFNETISKNIVARFVLINHDMLEVYAGEVTQKWIRIKIDESTY